MRPASPPREIDGDDGVDRLAAGGVILAHADPAIAAMIDHPVGEPPLPVTRRRLRRQRLRHGCVRRQAIETAVGEVGEGDGAVPHGPRAAAVFVHARARVEWRWNHVGRRCALFGAHHHRPALLLRTPFQPVDVSTVEPHVRQRNRLRDDEVRRDRRFPRAIRRGLGLRMTTWNLTCDQYQCGGFEVPISAAARSS